MLNCKYCENVATKTLVWLKDKRQCPARISGPWCGCDLQEALRRFWPNPYKVVEGEDYEVLAGTKDSFYRTKVLVEVEVEHQFDVQQGIGIVTSRLTMSTPAIKSVKVVKAESNFKLHEKPLDEMIPVNI